jgi:hypothetical protein
MYSNFFSAIQRPQVKMVEDWARRVGAEISLTYSSAVTHIIVQVDEENCAQRTLKFFYGVASGKWIVGIDWIHQCIRETRLIDEEPRMSTIVSTPHSIIFATLLRQIRYLFL